MTHLLGLIYSMEQYCCHFFPWNYQWNKEIFVAFSEIVESTGFEQSLLCLWDFFKGTEVNLSVLHAFGETASSLTECTQSWHSLRV